MKYLKSFENHSAYEAAQSSLILPNVSLCVNENEVHYNPSTPPTPTETRVVCKYNVGDTEYETKLCDDTSNFSAMEIDGVEQPSVTTRYTFSTTGEHTVKYTLTDPTSIGISAFAWCERLTSIVIPNGVTSIGKYALEDCYRLTSVTIPNSVTTIDDGLFGGCEYITNIEIPSGVTSIGNQDFAYCSSLTNINIPDSITSIDDCAFYQCDSLNATARDAIYAINPSAFTCD